MLFGQIELGCSSVTLKWSFELKSNVSTLTAAQQHSHVLLFAVLCIITVLVAMVTCRTRCS